MESVDYLISGINGNVGNELLPLFLKNSDITYKKADLKKNINAKCFIHLAAKTGNNYNDLIDSNIEYLRTIIEYCYKNGIKKFIFFSAMSIYGNQNKLNVSEKSSYKNLNLYSTSKLFGEKILEESSLKCLILRLPMILTKDSSNGFLNRFLLKLNNDETIYLYNAKKLSNNFIDVESIFNFIIGYRFEKQYELLNLALEQEMSLKDIVLYLKKEIKSKSTILENNEKYNFFNISIEKAKVLYGFTPNNTKSVLKKWVLKRKRNNF
ncbi:SDR family oxidoreductase [Halarcobacter ebronensis]|uniref:NAD-dependent epimerase/dehydratase domain-containing protein n=1 Tax=Halarcobacter ebronensis TaxID=1462615 RepID=A0A4Q1ANQ1_9BACT|nr:SDR family oxidoreductase [Halarcobacter ebronensis]QKF83314.1 short-chain dehydrogenase/reductase [Halarcobacter ebronensis]RXK05876.1 hypothetical protein CRV07_07330 [Halarcobacter ebronensis]